MQTGRSGREGCRCWKTASRRRTPPSVPRRWFFWLVPVLATLLTAAVAELLLALFWPVPFPISGLVG